MRTVFLGTSEFAAAVLERLAGAGEPAPATDAPRREPVSAADSRAPGRHRPALVVTRPDRPAGRGRRLRSPPAAHAARALGIELAQPASVNDEAARALIAGAQPRVVVVCAFGALISEPLLSEHELLNAHPSLLPRWRGAAPVERAIMAGDARTGVSIMRLTAGLDSGPVCLCQDEPILPEDTYGSLATRLQLIAAQLLVRALDDVERGRTLRCAEQDDAQATYAEKIAPADRLLDPARPAIELERAVRALQPHIGARVALPDGATLGVLRARAAPADERVAPGEPISGRGALGQPDSEGAAMGAPGLAAKAAPAPGELCAANGRLLYGTIAGALELLEVQPAGGRPMDAGSYLRGHGV